MGTKTKKEDRSHSASVQTARQNRHPFSVLDRHRPLSLPEFEVFDAIREAVPIVGAAVISWIAILQQFLPLANLRPCFPAKSVIG